MATKDSHFTVDGTLSNRQCGHGFPLLTLHQLMPFQSTTKKTGQKAVHLNIDNSTIDGMLMIYSPEHLKRFQGYLNTCHFNISFTIENKKDNTMSFLDVNIIREQGKFSTCLP